MKKQITLLSVLVLAAQFLMAQPAIDPKIIAQYPREGKPLFEVKLKGVKYTDHPDFSISDWKGEWVVIDFFTMGCSACFESLPKMKKLQHDYAGKVKFLMIGDTLGKLPAAYEIFRKRLGLTMPVYFDQERELFKKFGIRGVPHIVIVSPEGIVRGITARLNKEILDNLFSGNGPQLETFPYQPELDSLNALYNSEKPLLIRGNGGNDTVFLFRSLLTKWTRGHYDFDSDVVVSGSTKLERITITGRVQVIGYSIADLYLMAYGDTLPTWKSIDPNSYNRAWRFPIYETKDSSKIGADRNVRDNFYDYSLIVPPEKSSAIFLQKMMQRDLASYFGYEVSVETRMMPCWKMKVVDGFRERLTKPLLEKPAGNWNGRQGFYLKNKNVNQLLKNLFRYFQDGYPIFDETGITGSMSIVVRALTTDFKDVRRSLLENGIILVAGKTPMKVVVIKDRSKI